MTVKEYMESFNKRAKEIGHELRITVITEEGKEATALVTTCAGVSMVVGKADDVIMAQIICSMEADALAHGICAMCTATDILMGVTETVRNGYLERLNLYNGGIASGKKQRTIARGWELSAQPRNPGKKLFSFFIKKVA